MKDGRIGVGIIGVTPWRSWSAIAHIPALRALDHYEITALCTTRAESAAAAAEEFDVPLAFDDYRLLVAEPTVDLVVVAVKVPHHFELVSAALDAGKMVYCEWPLGNGLEEAVLLADHARSAGSRCAVGLQARAAPVINYVRDLVRDGFVGDVLSTTLIGSGMSWGPVLNRSNAYLADRANGATLLSIPFGHAVDALCYCLGGFAEANATSALRRPEATVLDTGETIAVTTEDQIAVTGTLNSGAVAVIHYRGGASRGTNLLWEINGTDGDLQIQSSGGHVQMADLHLAGGRGAAKQVEPMDLPAEYRWAPADAEGNALNVAQAFERFARDLRDGTHLCPDFDEAVATHALIARIDEAAASGARVRFERA